MLTSSSVHSLLHRNFNFKYHGLGLMAAQGSWHEREHFRLSGCATATWTCTDQQLSTAMDLKFIAKLEYSQLATSIAVQLGWLKLVSRSSAEYLAISCTVVFSLKRGRVAPRHAIEREKGWGSNVTILHTSYSNSTGVHRALLDSAVQVHNHKYLAVQTTSCGLV